eukprot:scaffold897_cov402-Prasinococcus_capsulatus_cf.AAC.15
MAPRVCGAGPQCPSVLLREALVDPTNEQRSARQLRLMTERMHGILNCPSAILQDPIEILAVTSNVKHGNCTSCPEFSYGLVVDTMSANGTGPGYCDCEVTCLLRDTCCIGAIDPAPSLAEGIHVQRRVQHVLSHPLPAKLTPLPCRPMSKQCGTGFMSAALLLLFSATALATWAFEVRRCQLAPAFAYMLNVHLAILVRRQRRCPTGRSAQLTHDKVVIDAEPHADTTSDRGSLILLHGYGCRTCQGETMGHRTGPEVGRYSTGIRKDTSGTETLPPFSSALELTILDDRLAVVIRTVKTAGLDILFFLLTFVLTFMGVGNMLIPGYQDLELTFTSVFNLMFDPFDLSLLEEEESRWRRAIFYFWYMTFEVSHNHRLDFPPVYSAK